MNDKVLSLVNQHIKVTPPLVLEDIEAAHRLGKPPPKPFVPDPAPREYNDDDDKSGTHADQSSRHRPPPLHVKSSSSSRVGAPSHVWCGTSPTERTIPSKLQMAQLRRSGAIPNTWTYDSQILIKDLHNKIKPTKAESNLNKNQ